MCHNPQNESLKPVVVIFHHTTSPLQFSLSGHQTAYPLHKLTQHRARGRRRNNCIYPDSLSENQQTSFSSFVSDTCANSFVFLFGRRKGGSQEHTPYFKLEAEGLYTYSFNKFRIVVQILQPKTAGVS